MADCGRFDWNDHSFFRGHLRPRLACRNLRDGRERARLMLDRRHSDGSTLCYFVHCGAIMGNAASLSLMRDASGALARSLTAHILRLLPSVRTRCWVLSTVQRSSLCVHHVCCVRVPPRCPRPSPAARCRASVRSPRFRARMRTSTLHAARSTLCKHTRRAHAHTPLAIEGPAGEGTRLDGTAGRKRRSEGTRNSTDPTQQPHRAKNNGQRRTAMGRDGGKHKRREKAQKRDSAMTNPMGGGVSRQPWLLL